ncbi:MAG: hypothetical protein HZA20_10995 [Nitrospirae bacterium]|nr:hypothetical protein [Nitrospirota bacterium]
MTSRTLRLSALDTWFFRESRPHGSVGGTELDSVFPPPPRTVAGAVRTMIGNHAGADWDDFKKCKETPYLRNEIDLRAEIGWGDDTGKLAINGPWLTLNGSRLYPAPSFLVKSENSGVVRLAIGPSAVCDLGCLHLPILGTGSSVKPIENAWLTHEAFNRVLGGGVPDIADILCESQLVAIEPRLGIARNNAVRTAENGMLYQARHIRPDAKFALEVDISGIAERLHPSGGATRFGGEGRLALVESLPTSPLFPQPPEPLADTKGVILILLTPSDTGGCWLPNSSFKLIEEDGVCYFDGKINGIGLRIVSAVLGKAIREGGWDLAQQKPRPARSLIPAGSAWYCTVAGGDIKSAIQALHNSQIGLETSLGRGHLAVGLWNNSEYPDTSRRGI